MNEDYPPKLKEYWKKQDEEAEKKYQEKMECLLRKSNEFIERTDELIKRIHEEQDE
jgi:hypothetical protein